MDYRQVLPRNTLLDGKYRIERVIGAGGFGITYEATDIGLSTRVAIKEYYPAEFGMRDASFSVRPRTQADHQLFERLRSSFMREARTLARFDQPTIVRVLNVFPANGTAYMVMSFEAGPSLKAWLAALGRPPTQAELDRITSDLLDALEMMHAAEFLHRDIAPDNILMRDDGSPVLLDFGAARRVMGTLSGTMTSVVKRGYSPPEQYAMDGRSQGPWTDIYALAATLYHAVAGHPPMEATERMLEDRMPPLVREAKGNFRPSFLTAIDDALRLLPKERVQSIAEWRRALFAGVAGAAPSADRRPPAAESSRRHAAATEPGQVETIRPSAATVQPATAHRDPLHSIPSNASASGPPYSGAPASTAPARSPWQRPALVAGLLVVMMTAATGGYIAWGPDTSPVRDVAGSRTTAPVSTIDDEAARREAARRADAARAAKAAEEAKARERAAAEARERAATEAREERARKALAEAEARRVAAENAARREREAREEAEKRAREEAARRAAAEEEANRIAAAAAEKRAREAAEKKAEAERAALEEAARLAKEAFASLQREDAQRATEEQALIIEIRRELNRVGCRTDATARTWTEADQRALQRFADHTGGRFSFLKLDREIPRTINAFQLQVCPAECKDGERLVDGACQASTTAAASEPPVSCQQINERAQLGQLSDADRKVLQSRRCR